MFEPTNSVLASLRDFIGDALAEDGITPSDIIDAIRDELKELIDYHKIQGAKAQKVLDMLQSPDELLNFNDRFREIINEKNVEEDFQDKLTYGGQEFVLNSDYLNNYNPSSSFSDDTISFTFLDDDDDKKKKGKKFKRNK